MNQLVIREDIGSVAIVTLNRPDRHNSLIPELLTGLLENVKEIDSNDQTRVMILQANGRSFSTGGDALGFVENMDAVESYSSDLVGLLNQVILAMVDLRVPVIAVVHGIVTGGSIGLVLASDIVIVSGEASFTPYYSVLGVSPDGGWVTMLAPTIGKHRAASILLLNQTMTAEQAVTWGIANRMVSAEHIREEAMKTAQIIVESKPGSIYHTKRLLNLDRTSLEVGLEAELEHFVQQIVTTEGREAFVDFLRQRHAISTSERMA